MYQTYRCKRNAIFQSSYRIFRDVSSRTVVFSVYRLALDAKWLVRAILHQAQGVFPVFVFLAKTIVSWCPIIYGVLLPLSHMPPINVRYIALL